MACPSQSSLLSLLLLSSVLLSITTQVSLAGRPTPAATVPEKKQHAPQDKKQHAAMATPAGKKPTGAPASKPDKKETECLDHEGTVLIPGIGRYMIGSLPAMPTIGHTFTGDSIPAAINGQYLPGNDDTFVPNPGFEVPNPAHVSGSEVPDPAADGSGTEFPDPSSGSESGTGFPDPAGESVP